jgi:hypothetical protein
VSVPVDLPNLDQLTNRQRIELVEAARLLRGETLSRLWTSLGPVHLHPGIEPDLESCFALRRRSTLSVTLAGVAHVLGVQNVECFAARIDPDSIVDHDDHIDVQFVPAGSDQANITYLPGVAENRYPTSPGHVER